MAWNPLILLLPPLLPLLLSCCYCRHRLCPCPAAAASDSAGAPLLKMQIPLTPGNSNAENRTRSFFSYQDGSLARLAGQ
jgi:hypothetical protein